MHIKHAIQYSTISVSFLYFLLTSVHSRSWIILMYHILSYCSEDIHHHSCIINAFNHHRNIISFNLYIDHTFHSHVNTTSYHIYIYISQYLSIVNAISYRFNGHNEFMSFIMYNNHTFISHSNSYHSSYIVITLLYQLNNHSNLYKSMCVCVCVYIYICIIVHIFPI